MTTAGRPGDLLRGLQKSVIVALMLLAGVFWIWTLHLDGFYCKYGATTASVAEGRIYSRHVCHGWQVFLTKAEKFNLDVLYPSISIGSVLIAGILDLRWKHFAFKNDLHGADLFYWFRRNKKK